MKTDLNNFLIRRLDKMSGADPTSTTTHVIASLDGTVATVRRFHCVLPACSQTNAQNTTMPYRRLQVSANDC